MKKIFFILINLLFFTSSAFCNDECIDITSNPVIKITSSFGNLKTDKTKSKQELTLLAKNYGFEEKGIFANGLSTTNINFDINLKTSSVNIKDNGYCLFPDEVNIFLGLDSPIIYLSKELKEKSCEYIVVEKHEQTHQIINKKTLEYYLPLFKSAATTIIKNIKPFYIKDTNNMDDENNKLANLYNQKLRPLVDFIKKEIIKEQQKLDNIENYKYEYSICN